MHGHFVWTLQYNTSYKVYNWSRTTEMYRINPVSNKPNNFCFVEDQ